MAEGYLYVATVAHLQAIVQMQRRPCPLHRQTAPSHPTYPPYWSLRAPDGSTRHRMDPVAIKRATIIRNACINACMHYDESVMNRIELPWEGEEAGPVAARIAARAAQRIAEGSMPAGEVLTEAMLAEGASASRTPAREAMLQLQSWGLVRLMPKKGALVTTPSAEERRDLLDVRTTWEIRSVQVISEQLKVRRALAGELRTITASQQTALDSLDPLGFATADFAFHRRIIEAGKNGIVNTLVTQLGPRFARLTHLAVAADLRVAAVFRDEHERLIEFIAAGDAAGFADMVRSHVTAGHFPTGAW